MGAEDVKEDEDELVVWVSVAQLQEYKNKLVGVGMTVKAAEMVLKPSAVLSIDENNQQKMDRFLQKLQEHEDVQRVYTNSGR